MIVVLEGSDYSVTTAIIYKPINKEKKGKWNRFYF